jgi:hypothetical protein
VRIKWAENTMGNGAPKLVTCFLDISRPARDAISETIYGHP